MAYLLPNQLLRRLSRSILWSDPAFYFWPTALVGIVVIKGILFLAVKPGPFVATCSVVTYFLLLLLATSFAIRNGIQNTLGSRPFWFFLAIGCGLWALNQWMFLYYQFGLHIDVPDNSIADPILYLHIVPLMAAVATLPDRSVSGRTPYRALLNSLLLLLFWGFIYGDSVFPYQYLFPNTQGYALRFDILYFVENLTLVVAVAILSLRAKAPWKPIYLHLLGASALYASSSAVANIAIDSGGYVDGKLYGLGLIASVCWFVWIPLRARRVAGAEATVTRSAGGRGLKASAWAMLAVVLICVPVVWQLSQTSASPNIQTHRLLVAIAAIVGLAVVAYIEEYLANRELLSDVAVANERLRSAMQSGKAVGWEWDIASGQDLWFGELQSMFGIRSDTYFTQIKEFYNYVHPEDRRRVSEAVAEAREKHTRYVAEFRMVWQDGTVRWVAASGEFRYSSDGKAERMLGMAVDITDRKQSEDAVRQGEERYRRIVETTSEGIWVLDSKFHISFVNQQMAEMLGYEPKEMIGRSVFDFYFSEDTDRGRQAWMRRWENKAEHFDARLKRKDCNELWARFAAVPTYKENGEFDGAMAMVSDVTEQRRVEESVRENQTRLASIIESAMDAIIAVDDQQHIVVFNATAEKIFGCSTKEALGQSLDRFIPQRFRSQHHAHISHFGETGVTNRAMGTLGALWALRANGAEFPIEASISQVTTSGTKLFTVIIRDITERERGEQALRESEQLKTSILESLQNHVVVVDSKGTVIAVNEPKFKFANRGVLAVKVGDDYFETCRTGADDILARSAAALTGIRLVFDGKQDHFEWEYPVDWTADRTWLLMSVNPLQGGNRGVVVSHQDITKRKRDEQAIAELSGRLINAQEQERSRIARELHDDINQQVALLAVEIQQLESTMPEEFSAGRQKAKDLWRKTHELSLEIQHISHRLHSPKLEHLGIAAALRGLCDELSKQGEIKADFQFKQASPAIDSTIALCLFRVAQESLHNIVKHSHAKNVRMELIGTMEKIVLRISDDGVGFDPESPRTQGGIGMISMTERIRLVGGSLSVWSRPSMGTQIEATVPLSRKLAP